jgi:hypothetical protein
MASSKYVLRFFFEWGGGCLWAGNDAARRDLDYGPYDYDEPCPLPLSPATIARCRWMAEWHDTALNWEYPPDPGPWDPAESARFDDAANSLLNDIRRELGPDYFVADHHSLRADGEMPHDSR